MYSRWLVSREAQILTCVSNMTIQRSLGGRQNAEIVWNSYQYIVCVAATIWQVVEPEDAAETTSLPVVR